MQVCPACQLQMVYTYLTLVKGDHLCHISESLTWSMGNTLMCKCFMNSFFYVIHASERTFNGEIETFSIKHGAKIDFLNFFSSRDYQTDPSTIQTSWDVSGDPCPAVKYEWAIRRLDGLEISSFLDMGCKN